MPKLKRTIAIQLHERWRELLRSGDPTAIAEKLGVSKATIDKALIYGNVHKQEIVDGITNFLASRILKEKEDSQKLGAMSRSQDPIDLFNKTLSENEQSAHSIDASDTGITDTELGDGSQPV